MSEPHQPLPIIRKELPRRSARCEEAPPPGLLAGIAQFNTGDYWECHETLEDLWRPEPDHIRYLYQGILQVGVGCYHLRRGNWRGAVNKLRSGIAYLAPSAPTCLGVDVARLRDEAGALLAALDALGPERVGEYDAGRLPSVRMVGEERAGLAGDTETRSGPGE
jgi:predicted metal-dependent hydrolase